MRQQLGSLLPQYKSSIVYKNVDSSYYQGEWKAPESKENPVMFSFNKINFHRNDFAEYLQNMNAKGSNGDLKVLIDDAYKTFVKEQLLAYEEAQLESKYPQFRALMNEYHDGVLLYEIMNDKVWNKAIKDTTGLKQFFEDNRSDFVWGKRVDADVYECDSKDIAQKVSVLLKNDTITPSQIMAKVNEKSALNVKIKSNKFELDNTAFLKDQNLKTGINAIYEFDGKFYVVKVKEEIPAGPKELNETKGAVTAAYQQYLETTWLTELSQKHPIKINTEVLYSLGNN